MPILAAFMVPHPPMIVPATGRGSEAQIRETAAAYQQVAEEIAALRPETVIVTSPHSVMYADYFHVSPGATASGSFAQFGAPQVQFEETYDRELVSAICDLAERNGFPAGTMGERDPQLDHGTMVPLWFLREAWSDRNRSAANGSGESAGASNAGGESAGSGSCAPNDAPAAEGAASGGGGSSAAAPDFKIVRIGLSGLPLADHYRMGQLLRRAVHNTGRRAVLIASGDLSHKLQDYGPYGFAAEGPQYDERVMDVCGRAAFGELLEFDETFCDKAAECGHRSFVIMAGAFDGQSVKAQRLVHQDVTGVGYGICTFYPEGPDEERRFLDRYLEKMRLEAEARRASEDAYVQLARQAVEAFVLRREVLPVPEDSVLKTAMPEGALPEDAMPEGAVPEGTMPESAMPESAMPEGAVPEGTMSEDAMPEGAVDEGAGGIQENAGGSSYVLPAELLSTRAGAFVSIHENGALRGCIGTIEPTRRCLAEEIIGNAISASTRDPRFSPICPEELPLLEISVDVLGAPEDIASESELDVKRYGVIVTNGGRRGLLLPDLEGVDTVRQQVEIAKQKAGIRPTEPVSLQRFEVIRHE